MSEKSISEVIAYLDTCIAHAVDGARGNPTRNDLENLNLYCAVKRTLESVSGRSHSEDDEEARCWMKFWDSLLKGGRDLVDKTRERVEALSDGVVAIICTLLVLELKIPVETRPGELGLLLVGMLPKFLSWCVSFFLVGKFWMLHAEVTRHALPLVGGRCVWRSVFFLLCLSFIPFPAALVGEHWEEPMSLLVFGLTMAANMGSLWLVVAGVRESVGETKRLGLSQPYVGVVGYALSGVCAYVHPAVSGAMFVVVPLLLVKKKVGAK